jgi:hypothetical protein
MTQAQATIAAAVIAGLFGGVIGNLVKARLDEASGNRRLRFERELNRQERVLQDQAKLLDDLTQAVWKWRYTSVQVSYAGRMCNECNMDNALESYRTQRWGDLHSLRTLASRSRRLVSKETHQTLLKFYHESMELDRRIEKVVRLKDAIRKAAVFGEMNSNLVNSYSDEIEEMLLIIGLEMKLISRSAREGAENGGNR